MLQMTREQWTTKLTEILRAVAAGRASRNPMTMEVMVTIMEDIEAIEPLLISESDSDAAFSTVCREMGVR